MLPAGLIANKLMAAIMDARSNWNRATPSHATFTQPDCSWSGKIYPFSPAVFYWAWLDFLAN